VVLQPEDEPVSRPGAVNLDLVDCVPVVALHARLGRLAEEPMRTVCAALAVAVDWRA
jgi:mRNA interferase MazF